MPDGPAAEDDPGGQAPDGTERLLGHLDSYFLVAELVAGWRAGLLQALLAGPGTAAEIAGRAGAHERSTAEWLALLCAADLAGWQDGTFTAAPGLELALDAERLGFDLTVLLEMVEQWPRLMPDLARSLADGRGIPYAAYQPEFSGHVDRLKEPLYRRYLVGDWLAAVGGLPGRLAEGVEVADVGCGAGQALLLAAAEWPASRFVGYELADAALELGRRRAAEQGLANLRFERRDATRLELEQAFDVVLALDTVHDLPDPLAALAGIRPGPASRRGRGHGRVGRHRRPGRRHRPPGGAAQLRLQRRPLHAGQPGHPWPGRLRRRRRLRLAGRAPGVRGPRPGLTVHHGGGAVSPTHLEVPPP